MPAQGGSFTNHPAIIDYKGKSLFFYHNAALPGGGGFKRSVSVEEFTYGDAGSIPSMQMTADGASAVDALNPFVRTEAETIAWASGIETEVCSEGGMNVTAIEAGDYIKVKEVEFGAGATAFEARVAAAAAGGVIELRLDSENGTLVGTCTVGSTGGDQTWATQSCVVSATGRHDLFFKFTGGGFKFNWWRFTGPGEPAIVGDAGTDAGGAAGSDGDMSSGGTSAAGGASPGDGTNSMGSNAAGGSTSSIGGAGGGSDMGEAVLGGPARSSDRGGCSLRVGGHSRAGSLACVALGLLAFCWFRRRAERSS
jgi:hypothetical protein